MRRASTVRPGTAVGPGRVLVLAYSFFALAAGARSAVQLASHPGRAPVAYGLSAVAALIYLLGALMVHRADAEVAFVGSARAVCGIELLGVVLVGTVSFVRPSEFPDATVWSRFGAGYGYVPAVLPVLALWWLRGRTR